MASEKNSTIFVALFLTDLVQFGVEQEVQEDNDIIWSGWIFEEVIGELRSGTTSLSASGVLVNDLSHIFEHIAHFHQHSGTIVITMASVIEPFLIAEHRNNPTKESLPRLIPGACIDVLVEAKEEAGKDRNPDRNPCWVPSKLLATVFILFTVFAELVFLGSVATFALTAFDTHEKRSLVVGILCVVFGICMYASPLFVMKMVIETRSVKYMPFTLSFVSFLNGICWTTYALIKFDIFITIPNGLGTLLSIAQLILYGLYYRSIPNEHRVTEVIDADQKPEDMEAKSKTDDLEAN